MIFYSFYLNIFNYFMIMIKFKTDGVGYMVNMRVCTRLKFGHCMHTISRDDNGGCPVYGGGTMMGSEIAKLMERSDQPVHEHFLK